MGGAVLVQAAFIAVALILVIVNVKRAAALNKFVRRRYDTLDRPQKGADRRPGGV